MYQGTQEFIDAIRSSSRRFNARILIGEEIIEDISNIQLYGGCSGSEELTIGNTVSSYFTADIYEYTGTLENKEILLQLGVLIDEDYEYCPIGYFTVTKIKTTGTKISITAYDRMNVICSRLYSDTLTTPTIQQVLSTIATRLGITVTYKILSEALLSNTITESISGYSDREVIGYMASCLAANASFDRDGNLVIYQYDQGDTLEIDWDYYFDGMELNEQDCTVGQVYCSTGRQDTSASSDDESEDTTEVTYSYGSTGYTLSISNPLMTQTIFDSIKVLLAGKAFRPGSVSFHGDIRLDPWDKVEVTDTSSNVYNMHCFTITQSYDGGLSTSIACECSTETESDVGYKGPTATAIDRVYTELFLVNSIIANKVDTTYLTANYATINSLNAVSAKFETLTTQYADITLANVDTLNVVDGFIENLMVSQGIISDRVVSDTVTVTNCLTGINFVANDIKAGTLDAAEIDVVNLNCANLTVGTINGTQITSGTISLDNLNDELTQQLADTEESVAQAVSDAKEAIATANEIEVDCTNLIRTSKALYEVGRIEGTTGEDKTSTTRIRSDFIPIGSSTQYTLTSYCSNNIAIRFYKEDKTFDSMYQNKVSFQGFLSDLCFTTSDSAKYFRVVFAFEDTTSDITLDALTSMLFKLEKGDKSTAYSQAPEDIDESISENSISNWSYNGDVAYIDGNLLYAGTVISDAIAASAIVADKIATDAVTSVKIAAGAITTDKLTANSITTSKLATGAVTSDTIAASAITTEKISTDAITTDKLSADCVTADKILAGSITSTEINVSDLVATGLVGVNKLTASNINVNSLFAIDITASGTITGGVLQSNGCEFGKSGTYIDLVNGEIVTPKLYLSDSLFQVTSGSITFPSSDGAYTSRISCDTLYFNDAYGSMSYNNGTLYVSGESGKTYITDGEVDTDKVTATTLSTSGVSTFGGNMYLANGKTLYGYDTGGNGRTLCSLDSSNNYQFAIGGVINNVYIGSTSYTGTQYIRAVDYVRFQTENITVLVDSANKAFNPTETATTDIGRTSYRFKNGYYSGTIYAGSATIVTSDSRMKNTPTAFDERYYNLAEKLNFKLFKYNEGTSDRFHAGVYAQEVLEAMEECGITIDECAFVCLETYTDDEGNECELYCVRYEELNVLMNWYLRERLDRLEGENAS